MFLLFSLDTHRQLVIILSDNAHCCSCRPFRVTVDSVALAALTVFLHSDSSTFGSVYCIYNKCISKDKVILTVMHRTLL